MKKHNLLLVDDAPFILEGIGADLEIHGYQATRASSAEMAMNMLSKMDFNLVITDPIIRRC